MKKILLCFLFAACFPLSSALAQSSSKPVEYPVKSCGGKDSLSSLKIVGFKNYPPFSWGVVDKERFEKTGMTRYVYTGFVVEAMRDALKNMNVVRLDEDMYDSFDDAKKAALRGQLDLLFTTYYYDETKSGQDYVYPAYFGNPFIVVSRRTKQIDAQDPSELKGLRGVVRREEEIEPLIKGLLPTDTKLDVVDGPEAAFKALLSGEADFMISSPYAADAEAKRFKVKNELYFGKRPLRHIKFFAAFSKRSPCRKYKDVFGEKFLAEFEDKAEAEKRMQKYIQQWVDLHKDEPPLEYTKPASETPAPVPAAAPAPAPVPAGAQ